VREVEQRLIVDTLERTRNNRTQAARLLGISIRTLRNKLAEYRQRGEHVTGPSAPWQGDEPDSRNQSC
jgi:DNA-binding NtrC family response regulator